MGVLDFFYNLGGQVGRTVYQAGASVTAPSPPPQQTVAPPVLAAQANPVTQATQTYTERYSYTTPGSAAVPRPQVTSPILPAAQPIQSPAPTPIVRNELMGLPAPFRSQPTPIVSAELNKPQLPSQGEIITQRRVPTSLIGSMFPQTPIAGFVESGAEIFKKIPVLGAVAGFGGKVGAAFTPEIIETERRGAPILGQAITTQKSEITPPTVTSVYDPITGRTTITTTSLETLTETTKQPVTTLSTFSREQKPSPAEQMLNRIEQPFKEFDLNKTTLSGKPLQGESLHEQWTREGKRPILGMSPLPGILPDLRPASQTLLQASREHPVAVPVGIGTGIVLAEAFGIYTIAAESGSAAIGTVSPTWGAAALTYSTKVVPAALMGMYAIGESSKVTKGFSDVDPTRMAARFAPEAYKEAGVWAGFGVHGGGSRISEGYGLLKQDVNQFILEGTKPKMTLGEAPSGLKVGQAATTQRGAFDYMRASTGEAIDIGMKPYRAMQIEYLGMKQEIELSSFKTTTLKSPNKLPRTLDQPEIPQRIKTAYSTYLNREIESSVWTEVSGANINRALRSQTPLSEYVTHPIRTIDSLAKGKILKTGIQTYGEGVGGIELYRGLGGAKSISGKSIGDIYVDTGIQSWGTEPVASLPYASGDKILLKYTPQKGTKGFVNPEEMEITLSSGKYKIKSISEYTPPEKYEFMRGTKLYEITEAPTEFTPIDYLKYKTSLPAQYAMAKGEAGMIWAGEVRAKAGEVPLELYKGYFEAKIGAQTKLAELSIDYSKYKFGTGPEPNILGYAQSKLYPAYFEAKTEIPVKLAKASIWAANLDIAMQQTPDIAIKAWMQERAPKITPSIGYIPKGEKGAPLIRQDYGGDIGGSRMGYKMVGGKQVGSLRVEPSLQAMGKEFGTAELGGTEKGGMYITKQDFRGRPLSETMKPLDLSQTKQSAAAIQMYRTEQLPGIEPMTAPSRAPAITTGLISFGMQVPRARVQTEEIFAETTRTQRKQQSFMKAIEPSFAITPATQYRQIFATEMVTGQQKKQREAQTQMMSMEVMQGQRSRQVQRQAAVFGTDQLFKRSQESIRRQGFVAEELTGTRQRRDIITGFDIRQTSEQKQRQETATRQTTEQSTRILKTTDITKIIIPGLPYMPSGSDVGRRGGRGKSPFRETIGIKSMLAGVTKGIPKMKKGRMKKI